MELTVLWPGIVNKVINAGGGSGGQGYNKSVLVGRDVFFVTSYVQLFVFDLQRQISLLCDKPSEYSILGSIVACVCACAFACICVYVYGVYVHVCRIIINFIYFQ